MKKFVIFFLVFFILSTNIAFANDIEINVDAQSAILMDYKTGRILYCKNEKEPLAMASTTKIMTAILAIENGNLEDIVKVSKNATKAPPVKMHLKENEEIKLKDLLYALMLQSSNDAAVAIAEHIYKDVETFCDNMTKKAKEIGAKDTVFRTPNGLDYLDHHSTAYDMAIIARYALSNKQFMDIINTKQVSFKTNVSSYDIINKNRLLSEFEGANGVKTGYTGKAGHCFVGSATQNDMTLISVVLASGWGEKGKRQKWIDTKTLLNYGFKNFSYENILSKNDCLDTISIIKGEKDTMPLYYENDIVLPISNKDEKEKISVKLDYIKSLDAPIKKDEKVGVANIYINDTLVAQTNILTKEDVDKKTFSYYINDIFKNWANIIK
ncbi:D-alanyl-D-alanine carboxypeptidase family protein [uncultured Tyzzerella sp.]|uniref:D-alanyl-D-alanine carboxypeptidase family protein n=1 Tax=uncultured Tyzzerella sp. TaxID=2321398 RepID=UPI002942DDDD|nr:D-alanyl-D-alanine carboxypeptidase family protein [uncultured Tyzzerella sp.]